MGPRKDKKEYYKKVCSLVIEESIVTTGKIRNRRARHLQEEMMV